MPAHHDVGAGTDALFGIPAMALLEANAETTAGCSEK
jgi:hypothetical protein